ncbi:MAG: FAD:protein FMN transferase [Bacilli bacterium]
MKKRYKYLIGILLIISFGLIYFVSQEKETLKNIKTKKIFFMDALITIKLYNIKNSEEIFKNIDEIYSTYHNLTDMFKSYEGIVNIYDINNSKLHEAIKIDEKLYKIIELGKNYYEKTNGNFNIGIGNLTNLWRGYKENNFVPKNIPNNININLEDIVLENGKLTRLSDVKLDLGAIAKGYTTSVVANYLEVNKIHKYLINAGGNIIVGNHYNNKTYNIGIENPNNKSDIYKILNVNNKSVVTSGGYERFFEIDGKKYHHIIDVNTFLPANNYKSVTVISENNNTADILSTTLFLMDLQEGKTFAKKENVEVIWYLNNDEIITTKGVLDYEKG